MAVDQARQYRHAPEIYDFRPCWGRKAFADGFYLTVTNKNVLIGLYGAAIRIYQVPCFHEHHLRRGTPQPQARAQKQECNSICHDVYVVVSIQLQIFTLAKNCGGFLPLVACSKL